MELISHASVSPELIAKIRMVPQAVKAVVITRHMKVYTTANHRVDDNSFIMDIVGPMDGPPGLLIIESALAISLTNAPMTIGPHDTLHVRVPLP